MKAVWEGKVFAESDKTVVVEGNHYFPPDAIKREYFVPSDTHTTCHWKGVASYDHVHVGGSSNADAAWFYPEPKEAAKSIKDHVAFWRGVGFNLSMICAELLGPTTSRVPTPVSMLCDGTLPRSPPATVFSARSSSRARIAPRSK